MPIISFSDSAKTDLLDILTFAAETNSLEYAQKLVTTIRDEIREFIKAPLLGARVSGFSEEYRYRNVIKSRYRVYYRVLDEQLIVARIWPNRRKPLEPDEVF